MFSVFIIIIGIVVIVILDNKKGRAYIKKFTPTMRFIIAAGANTYQNAECTRVDVGGNPANSWAKNI